MDPSIGGLYSQRHSMAGESEPKVKKYEILVCKRHYVCRSAVCCTLTTE